MKMQEIGIIIEGLDGTSALDVVTEGFGTDGIYDAVLDAVIDYFYGLPTRRKIFKMLDAADNALMRILTNFGEVVDVYIVDVQPIWEYFEDEDEDDYHA